MPAHQCYQRAAESKEGCGEGADFEKYPRPPYIYLTLAKHHVQLCSILIQLSIDVIVQPRLSLVTQCPSLSQAKELPHNIHQFPHYVQPTGQRKRKLTTKPKHFTASRSSIDMGAIFVSCFGREFLF